MEWLKLSFQWYFYLFVLGIIFYPLTKLIFKKFSLDSGYPFAKTLAIIFISYSIYVLSSLKILPFTRLSLFLILGMAIVLNLIIYKKNKKFSKIKSPKTKIFFIFIEEFFFIFSFLFLTFIRGQEPSIRGLEKFMDFGFINSILRSQYFPPLDMWLSSDNVNPHGYAINYYYFGHLSGATLIRLTNIPAVVGYNLILATIFAQGITLVFSIATNLIFFIDKKIKPLKLTIFGLLGSYLVNLAGNLHTIYLFTKGYPQENPIPFWKILSPFNPQTYWYPNATRFIPFTIHEFPSYSYVVADLHGHVFGIPFVLTTLAFIIIIFFTSKDGQISLNFKKTKLSHLFGENFSSFLYKTVIFAFLGFLIAVNYMVNAFDGPIYFLLSLIITFWLFGLSLQSFYLMTLTFFSYSFFSLPFSSHFKLFVSGIGLNCSPNFLTQIGKLGPFLFEKGNCQISPLWMLFILWGFFWLNFVFFLLLKGKKPSQINNQKSFKQLSNLIFLLFSFGTFLILIPEFFYIKDIYPAHFRANTMFKLGYQAFIIMSITSAIVFYLLKKFQKSFFIVIYSLFFTFVFIYPFIAFPSYYGKLDKTPNLDGSQWLTINYPQDKEIIDYLNKNIKGQPVVLEAQGDSYTDYERISSYTGLPTVAGWWVHEWLWRGNPDIAGKRIPDIVSIYESKDILKTINLIKKYKIKFIVVSQLEKQKYPNLNEKKFTLIGEKIFQSSNKLGALYKVK